MTTPTKLRSGELFAGVGGLGMAIDEVFDASPAWFCEFDAAPSKVLAHHFPDVPNFGDVRSVDWATTERVNILAGGFPCQDVSLAGRRRGMKDGTRSGLWSEFAKAIDEVRPDWVVIENVRGLLSADAAVDMEPCPLCVGDDPGHVLRALGAVLGDLAGLGFDAEWTGIRAADVGAPHGRFRVFILAWPKERTLADDDCAGFGSVRRPSGIVERDADRRDRAGSSPRNVTRAQIFTGVRLLSTPDTVPEAPNTGSNSHKAGNIVGLGNQVMSLLPTPDAYSGNRGGSQHPEKRRDGGHTVSLADVAEHKLLGTPRVSSGNGAGNLQRRQAETNIESQVLLLPTPTASEGDKGGPNQAYGSGGSTLSGTVPHLVDWGVYATAVQRWESVFGRPVPEPVRFDGKGGKARLNPELTEWMMGWPKGWVTDAVIGLTRAEQLKACGNGVVPQQAAAALRILLARPGVPQITYGLAA